jgi:glycosyltransferase involved in cell wall biosynthesis
MTEATASATEQPLVSIVTVCFNAEAHLREAIECVLAQTYGDIEYVVIDGGSTDSTLAILREFEPRFAGRMRWVSEPDEGLYDAMNKGVAAATGDLIGLLNADDLYPADAVERAVGTWLAHPSAGVIYGDTCNIDEHGTPMLERPAPPVITLEVMMEGMIVCHQSMFVTAETYRAIGAYDTRYRILADYDFLMRCVRAGVEFANAGANLSLFRLGGASGQFIRALDRELTQIRIVNGANPVAQWALYYKHAAASFTYDALKGNRGFVKLYDRYKQR